MEDTNRSPLTLRLLPGGGASSRVIELTEARRRFDPERCEHTKILVDAELAEVLCTLCETRLNPTEILRRMAQQESRWAYEREQRTALLQALDAKQRTKCQHCHRFTRVRT